MRARRLAASIFASCVLIGLAGCGGGSATDAKAPAQKPSAAAALTKGNFADEVRAAQAGAGSAHVEATVESQGQTLKLSGDVAHLDTPQAPAFDFSADVGSQKIQLRAVDKVLYVAGVGIPGSGKKWIKIDVSDSTNPIGQIFQAANPGNFASYLDGATTFKDKGEQTVDGVATRHYSVTVDTATMLKSNPVFKGQDVSKLGLPESLTSDVYVDSANLPIEIKVDLAAAGAFEAHFSDYGKTVSITAPPKNQVGRFSLGN